MKLSRASTYAVHALAYLAEQGEEHAVASHTIAKARGIPERFLLKVLKPLASGSILRSMKGPNGGYRLARPMAKITLLEVIEIVEGPIRGLLPSFEGSDNQKADDRLEAVCDQAAEALRKQLRAVTLAELVGEGGKKK